MYEIVSRLHITQSVDHIYDTAITEFRLRSPYVVYLEQANQLSISVALETGVAKLVNGASKTTNGIDGTNDGTGATDSGTVASSAATSQQAMRARSLLLFAVVALLAAFAPSLLCSALLIPIHNNNNNAGRVFMHVSLLCIAVAILAVSNDNVSAQLPDLTANDRCEPGVDLTIAVPPSVRRLCDDNSCLCNVGWSGADCSTPMMVTEVTTSNVTLPPVNIVTCNAGEVRKRLAVGWHVDVIRVRARAISWDVHVWPINIARPITDLV